ncbi:MAG: dihydroxyacetone kinase subunit L [Kiritimatiellae bacterium]|nr:dihydroxyacetone kinase subunit L [Kiritimatiellia bacterium]
MSTTMTVEDLKRLLAPVCAGLTECAGELNRIDAQLGDGDIGITVTEAASRIRSAMDGLPQDLGKALLLVAQSITKSRASSYGTLLATGLMAMARHAMGQTEIAIDELPAMLESAVNRMAARGGSRLGEKTVLDAVDAIRIALLDVKPGDSAARLADAAVDEALRHFKDKPCKQGRARIFADKSVGLDDPGMVAIKKIVAAMASA